MSDEATKTKACFGYLEERILKGKGLDIGCGKDPIFPHVRGFDTKDGDANKISAYINETFDFVFSSHCLEHMNNPYSAIQEWWKLVKEGGCLYVAVPDEDLYEQGVFPSRFNVDHKWSFTMNKESSWSIRSINVIELISTLPQGRLLKLELQDKGYDYSRHNEDQTWGPAMAQICFVVKKDKSYPNKNYTVTPVLFYCWLQGLYNSIAFPILSVAFLGYELLKKIFNKSKS